ncbi:MAG: hypothetical protein IJJ26_11665 [Victivallales bacterium]|nr:hypothetical protein [Victivallales bacterium]
MLPQLSEAGFDTECHLGWWLADLHFWYAGKLLPPEILRQFTRTPRTEELLSQHRRQRVFEVEFSEKPLIVKQFLLNNWRRRLERENVGLCALREQVEFSHIWDGRVPQCLAYFEKRIFGVPVMSGFVMERLEGFRELKGDCPADLERAAEMLETLHRRELYHADFKCGNILWNEHKEELTLIDYDHWKTCTGDDEKQRALLYEVTQFLLNGPVDEKAFWKVLSQRIPCTKEPSFREEVQRIRNSPLFRKYRSDLVPIP